MAANSAEATSCASCGAPRTFSRRCHACGALFPGQVAAVGTAPPPAASTDPAAPAAGAPVAAPMAPVPSAAAVPAPSGPPSATIAEVSQKFSGNMPFVELRGGKTDLLVGYRTSRDGVSAEEAAAADANVQVKAYIMDMNYQVVRVVELAAGGNIVDLTRSQPGAPRTHNVIGRPSGSKDEDFNFADVASYPVRAGVQRKVLEGANEGEPKQSVMLFIALEPRVAEKARALEWVSCAISVEETTIGTRAVPDVFSLDAATLGGCTGFIPGYFYIHVTNDTHSGAALALYELTMPLQGGEDAVAKIQAFQRAEFPPLAHETRSFVVPDNHFAVGLGWTNDCTTSRSTLDMSMVGFLNNVDLDLSCLICDDQEKVVDVVCFNRLSYGSDAIRHSGDKGQCGSPFSYGAGRGDSEQIEIDLARLPANITKLFFLQTQYENYQYDVRSYVRVMLGAGKHTVRLMDIGGGRGTPATFVFYLQKTGGQWHYNQMDWAVSMKPHGVVQTWADVVIPLQVYLDQGMGPLWADNDAYFSSRYPALPMRHELPMPPPVDPKDKFPDPTQIRHVPEETQILCVKVCGAVNLLAADKDGKSDPWVKMSLVGQTTVINFLNSTDVVDHTCHPRFSWVRDDYFFYDLKDEVVKFEAFDKDTFSSESLGVVTIPASETHVRGPVLLHLTGSGPKGRPATGFVIVKFAWTEHGKYSASTEKDGLYKPASYKWGSKYPSCTTIHPDGGECKNNTADRPCYMLNSAEALLIEHYKGRTPYSL